MPIIGIDDTDSKREMCTTYLTIEIIKNSNLDLIGFPKLVRLNPNIPLKTRGNAAISLVLGRGEGEKTPVGKIGEETVFSYQRHKEERMDIDVMSIIEKFSPRDPDTNPAVIITREPNEERFYWDAVREFVDYKEVLTRVRGEFSSINGEVGVVGANAAVSWPGINATYELIAYLDRDRWSGEHLVDESGSILIEKSFPDTFDSFDFRNNYNAIRPTTKTPVLFGIRGVIPERLMEYKDFIRSEPFSSYITFKTNQGTDDHLLERPIGEVGLYQSAIVRGFVLSAPRWSRGGILTFDIGNDGKRLTAVAMEPTKEFRITLSKLRKGDEVRVYGGVTRAGNINVEKIQVVSLSKVSDIAPPRCPNCKTRMESAGRDGGFRCRKCGTRSKQGEVRTEEREISPGFYEVPVIARRHLARPLKLGVSK